MGVPGGLYDDDGEEKAMTKEDDMFFMDTEGGDSSCITQNRYQNKYGRAILVFLIKKSEVQLFI